VSAPPSSTLVVEFGGWYQCRMAIDPDPTWEPRGVSGYTRAVGRESDFDRVLWLQKADIPDGDYRRAEDGNPANQVGVVVTAARVDGGPAAGAACLVGAEVRLRRRAQYILWNQIVADGVERLVPPIVPFEIELRRRLPEGEIVLRRYDPLVPGETGDKFWEVGDPRLYRQRLPVDYVHLSSEVMEAIGVSDFNAYFQVRQEWLELQVGRAQDPVEREALAVRLGMIERFSQSPDPVASPGLMVNRLGLQCVWAHPIRGAGVVEGEPLLGGRVLHGGPDDPALYWHTRFWHGGWDGDLMRGFMQGELRAPFQPA
jgi:hypothetical protein